jgi:spore maturation protein CgeB
MKIALYGSSLLSCYWNGAATYYRGLLKALAVFGHQISFYEPDILDRQRYRDIAPPDWCEVVVYPATYSGLCAVVAQASRADVVIKASRFCRRLAAGRDYGGGAGRCATYLVGRRCTGDAGRNPR